MLLVTDNRTQVAILKGEGDELAAEKIVSALCLNTAEIQVRNARDQDKELLLSNCIIIGSSQSNPLISGFLEKAGLNGRYRQLNGEGYILKTISDKILLVAGATRVSTLYAACDLKNYYLNYGEKTISADELNIIEEPILKYRWFWNWDSRTHWVPVSNRKILSGHGNGFYPHRYEYEKDVFIQDFKTMLDYAAELHINGVVIWGFLRDEHGGVEAAQELCRFAEERGVRIIPGVGPNQYNGFYYSGNNRFNSITWTQGRPDLQALGPVDGFEKAEPIPTTLCLQKAENQSWLRDGVNWMYDSFDSIGGLDVETSEAWVCNCEDHKRISKGIHLSGSDQETYTAFPDDVELAARIIMKEARRRDPEAWIVLNTYNDLGTYPEKMIQRLMEITPEAIVLWMERVRCQAKGKYPGINKALVFNWAPRGFDKVYHPLQWYKDSIENAWRNGMDGVQIFGEGGAYLPCFELAYLAFSALAWNPRISLDQLVRKYLARFWGGEKAAMSLLEILPLVKMDINKAYQEAEKNAVSMDSTAKTHWEHLLKHILNQRTGERK